MGVGTGFMSCVTVGCTVCDCDAESVVGVDAIAGVGTDAGAGADEDADSSLIGGGWFCCCWVDAIL